MKFLVKIIRTLLFITASLISISFIYQAYGWLMLKLIDGLEYLSNKLHWIIFWILFFAFGWILVKMCINLFSLISSSLTAFIAMICPSKLFATWISGIFAVANLVGFIYLFWTSIVIDSFLTGLTAVIVIGLSILLTFDIVSATKQGIIVRDMYD